MFSSAPEEIAIHNTRLMQRLQAIERFGVEEQDTVIKLIDAMIAKHQMEATLNTLGG